MASAEVEGNEDWLGVRVREGSGGPLAQPLLLSVALTLAVAGGLPETVDVPAPLGEALKAAERVPSAVPELAGVIEAAAVAVSKAVNERMEVAVGREVTLAHALLLSDAIKLTVGGWLPEAVRVPAPVEEDTLGTADMVPAPVIVVATVLLATTDAVPWAV